MHQAAKQLTTSRLIHAFIHELGAFAPTFYLNIRGAVILLGFSPAWHASIKCLNVKCVFPSSSILTKKDELSEVLYITPEMRSITNYI